MASAVLGIESKGTLRFSWWDALFIALALLHAVVLAEWPVAAVIAIGVWWNSNTIAHNFIHRPFFRAPFLNLLFSAYLSVLLGIPQALWRDRHLAHHGGIAWRLRPAWGAYGSRWPALLGWFDAPGSAVQILDALEKLVLRSRWLQWFVLRSHRRAFSALVPQLPPVHRVAIVGGGLFPRTALILLELLPGARIVIVDANARNLETARSILGGSVEFVNRHYLPGDPCDCDLIVIPLSFDGDRTAIYRRPPSRAVLVHDWVWRPRGTSKVVSAALL